MHGNHQSLDHQNNCHKLSNARNLADFGFAAVIESFQVNKFQEMYTEQHCFECDQHDEVVRSK